MSDAMTTVNTCNYVCVMWTHNSCMTCTGYRYMQNVLITGETGKIHLSGLFQQLLKATEPFKYHTV